MEKYKNFTNAGKKTTNAKFFVRCLFKFQFLLFILFYSHSSIQASMYSEYINSHIMTSAKCEIDSLIFSKIKIPNLNQSILHITKKYNNDEFPSNKGILDLLKLLNFDSKEQEKILELFIHESGNFKSKLAINGNNLCGMRKPSRRIFLGKENTIYTYAAYEHWHLSVLDFYIWFNLKPWNQKESFKTYLKKRKWN